MEAEAYASLGRGDGARVLRVAGAVCTAVPSLSGSTMLNRVTGLGLDRPAGEAELDAIDAFFADAGTAYAVAVAPQADPSLTPRLHERGFQAGYAWMVFRRGVEAPPLPEPRLRVEPTRDVATFGRLVAGAYELPPAGAELVHGLGDDPSWTLFLARAGDEPVGAAALFAHEDCGWLGFAATLRAHRGAGAQTSLLARRIAHARDLGLRELVTETGERLTDRPSVSYRNILRVGFGEAYVRPNLVSPSGG